MPLRLVRLPLSRQLLAPSGALALVILFLSSGIEPAVAVTPVTAVTPIKLGTCAASSDVNCGLSQSLKSFGHSVCFAGGYYIAVWIQSVNAGNFITTWDYSYSSDTVTWSAPATLYTSTVHMSGPINNNNEWDMNCAGSSVATTTLGIAYACASNCSTTLLVVHWNKITFPSSIATPVPASGTDQSVTGITPTATSVDTVIVYVDTAGNVFLEFQNKPATTVKDILVENEAKISTLSSVAANQVGYPFGLMFGISNGFAMSFGQTSTGSAPGAVNFYNSTTLLGTGRLIAGGTLAQSGTKAIFAADTATCYVESYDISTRLFTETANPGGITSSCPNTLAAEAWALSDGGLNVWAIYGTSTYQFAVSTDGGLTYTAIGTFSTAYTGFASLHMSSMNGLNTVGNVLTAVAVEYDAARGVYVQVFQQGTPSTTTGTINQTVGSCTNAGGTFTMVNQTLYMYYGTSLQNEAVNNIQIGVQSVGGSTGTHTIQLVIYAGTTTGPIGPSNLLTLMFAKQITMTSGTGNAILNIATSGITLPGPGVIWGVGVVGDNKVILDTSSLGGMFIQSGVPLPTAQQNAFFTTQGTSVGTELDLCATASYQLVTTITTTQTVTTLSVTGGLCTATSTNVITSLDSNAAMTSSTSYVLIIIMLLGPAVILGAVGALTRSAALTGGLFIGGMAIGAGAGNLSGIIPFNILALVVVVIVLLIMALIMAMTRGGGGGA